MILRAEEDPGEKSEISIELRRAALRSLLDSRTLASRARLRQVLTYVGDTVLEGRGAELKEQTLASVIFGRPPDHDTADDNIVRVTARQLRAKMEEYYLTEGKSDPVRVVMPRGTYAPVFVDALAAPVAQAPPGRRGIPTIWLAGWGIATVSLFGLAWVLVTGWRIEPKRPISIVSLLQPVSDQRLLVVCADAAVQFIKATYGVAPSLSEYQQGLHLRQLSGSPADQRVLAWMGNVRLFGVGNVYAVETLIPSFAPRSVLVRHPTQVTERDFVDSNVILLSGPFANPWVQLFESKLNFQVTEDAERTVFIRNLKPRAGEVAEYRVEGQEGSVRTYSRMAFLPNLSGRGRVLLIGGPSSSLLEVLSRSLADGAFYQELRDRLGLRELEPMPFFEVLASVEQVGRAPVAVRVLAVRRWN